MDFNPLRPSGNYMYQSALTVSNAIFCVCALRMILTVHKDNFLKHHHPVYICNGGVWCSL
jgi:hypothetical protein